MNKGSTVKTGVGYKREEKNINKIRKEVKRTEREYRKRKKRGRKNRRENRKYYWILTNFLQSSAISPLSARSTRFVLGRIPQVILVKRRVARTSNCRLYTHVCLYE